MTSAIGFVLVTHAAPTQVARLVQRLDTLFDHPPVTCHHDFSQCDLSVEAFGGNVSFVRPYLPTRWGEASTVEATLRALRLMYGDAEGPDWCVLLSGADYPIKPAGRILADLNAGGYDAHILHELIDPRHFERPWQELCYRRYYGRRIRLPYVTRRLRFKWRDVQLPPWLVSGLAPFSDGLRCYAGSNWFSLNRRAARYLVEHLAEHQRLMDHSQHVWNSDEFYFQTILANAGSLKLNNQNHRFTEWSDHGVYPKVLGFGDIPALLASPCHFARKFAPDRLDVLDAVDAAVDNLAPLNKSRPQPGRP